MTNIDFKLFSAWMQGRLGEPSTWASIAVGILVAYLRLHPTPDQLTAIQAQLDSIITNIFHAAAGLSLLLGMVMKEKGASGAIG